MLQSCAAKSEIAAPRRGGVLRGQRQGTALHPRLCGGHPYAGSGRALPCTHAFAAGTPTRGAAGRCPAPAPLRRAPLRGERQGAALHPRLCGEHPYAGSGRALPCTRAFAAGTKGRCPLDSRRGFSPGPEMLTHLRLACGRDRSFGAPPPVFAITDRPAIRTAGRSFFSLPIHPLYFVPFCDIMIYIIVNG